MRSVAMRAMVVVAMGAVVLPRPATATAAPISDTCPGGSPTWREVGETNFSGILIGGSKSQGIATDGTRWWFSWQYGLSRTGPTYRLQAFSPIAIPPDLLIAGSSHIGDIDYDHGHIVAPIEDNPQVGGPAYQHPWLVYYDPTTLLPTGERYELPQALQIAGVPWVAIDHAHHLAITAEWNDTTVLNRFDLDHGMQRVDPLPLSRTLGRIQGAKVWGHWLYASRDDAHKSVVRIDLNSGAVEDVYQVNLVGEQEGIAVRPMADGSLLHVLFVHGTVDDPAHFHVTLHHLAPSCPV